MGNFYLSIFNINVHIHWVKLYKLAKFPPINLPSSYLPTMRDIVINRHLVLINSRGYQYLGRDKCRFKVESDILA